MKISFSRIKYIFKKEDLNSIKGLLFVDRVVVLFGFLKIRKNLMSRQFGRYGTRNLIFTS